MKVERLPSGTYRVVVYLGRTSEGKRIRKSFTGSDAKRVLREATVFADEHREIRGSKKLKSAIHKYIESREPVLSPCTIRNYLQVEKYFNENYSDFLDKDIYTLSSADMQNLVNKLAQGHKPKTIRNFIGLISSSLKYSEINMPYVRLPERTRPDFNIPDDVTMKRVIKLSKGTILEIPILLAATGPLRRGEICALSPDDINGNVIHVSKDMVLTKDNVYVIKPPKTLSSNRYIELPDKVIELIKKQGYVTHLNPGQLTDKFRKFLEKNEIAAFRFHDIRHYCVSMLKAHNVPDIYIQQRGGWLTDNVMKTVYTHTLQNQSELQTKIMLVEFKKIIG